MPVCRRPTFGASIASNSIASAEPPNSSTVCANAADAQCGSFAISIFSTIESHTPQCEHFPIHVGVIAPHSVQQNVAFCFAMDWILLALYDDLASVCCISFLCGSEGLHGYGQALCEINHFIATNQISPRQSAVRNCSCGADFNHRCDQAQRDHSRIDERFCFLLTSGNCPCLPNAVSLRHAR